MHYARDAIKALINNKEMQLEFEGADERDLLIKLGLGGNSETGDSRGESRNRTSITQEDVVVAYEL